MGKIIGLLVVALLVTSCSANLRMRYDIDTGCEIHNEFTSE